MDENMVLDEDIITLTSDDGEELNFAILDIIDYEDEQYAVLALDDEEEDAEVVIMKVEAIDDETDSYISLDDETLEETLFNVFKERAEDFFDFKD